MTPAGSLLLGAALLLLAAGHQLPAVASFDQELCLTLHGRLSRAPWIEIFRVLWPLGRSELTLIALLALAVYDWRKGLSAALAFLIVAGVERLIKISLKRKRPYESQPGVHMLQPHRPSDPSFPSGDALRVWFLALLAAQVFQLPLPAALALAALAVLVSLGRVAMGVHYPLDTLGGAGLGLAAAGMYGLFRVFSLA